MRLRLKSSIAVHAVSYLAYCDADGNVSGPLGSADQGRAGNDVVLTLPADDEVPGHASPRSR